MLCILSKLQTTSLRKLKNRDERSASRSVRFHLLLQRLRHPINRRPLFLETVWLWRQKKSLLLVGTEADPWSIILLILPSHLIWTYSIRRINNYCFSLKHICPRIICSKSSSIPSGCGSLDYESVQICRRVITFAKTHTDFVLIAEVLKLLCTLGRLHEVTKEKTTTWTHRR